MLKLSAERIRYRNESKAYQKQLKEADEELNKAGAKVQRLQAEQGQVEKLKEDLDAALEKANGVAELEGG